MLELQGQRVEDAEAEWDGSWSYLCFKVYPGIASEQCGFAGGLFSFFAVCIKTEINCTVKCNETSLHFLCCLRRCRFSIAIFFQLILTFLKFQLNFAVFFPTSTFRFGFTQFGWRRLKKQVKWNFYGNN